MKRCASPLSNFPPKAGNLLSSKLDAELTPQKGERAIVFSPACGRGLRRGFAIGAGIWLEAHSEL